MKHREHGTRLGRRVEGRDDMPVGDHEAERLIASPSKNATRGRVVLRTISPDERRDQVNQA